MARQKDVIGPREFESVSRQWYRTLGEGRFRFRSTHKDDGSAVCTVERAHKWSYSGRRWDLVHRLRRPAG